MTQLAIATSGLFRDRDLFVHDGAKLRRIRLSAKVQAAFLLATFALIAWSSYAAARMIAPAQATPAATAPATASAQIASLAAETERRVVAIEQRQRALAAALANENVDPAALKRLGFYPAAKNGGRGGPFDGKADPTFKSLFNSWKKLDNISDAAIAVPSEKPVKTAAFTSGYGVRSDPFKGSAAMHAGIDLSGPAGTPIYATADGVVSEAGWHNGGYGNLIKITHGRGIETRYAHLSGISVRAGEQIKRGQLIGRMGSTGRSTGSHLHYEVRIDGRAVNPIPFMKSNDYLLAMQKKVNGAAMDAVAQGGPNAARR
jgi:murein DD-endopeptidase MepM/ murein hydrolase activator NlpD